MYRFICIYYSSYYNDIIHRNPSAKCERSVAASVPSLRIQQISGSSSMSNMCFFNIGPHHRHGTMRTGTSASMRPPKSGGRTTVVQLVTGLASILLSAWSGGAHGSPAAAATVGGNYRALYHVYHLDASCPHDGSKREISLSHGGAAIFTLNEADPKTATFLQKSDISCHLELEVPRGYGFAVFIEEMNLREALGSPPDWDRQAYPRPCLDYLQFGRDVGFVTSFKSQTYCGVRDRLHRGHNASSWDFLGASARVAAGSSGLRHYVEEIDREMDFWLKVRKRDMVTQLSNPPRKLTVVVTAFKKNCDDRLPPPSSTADSRTGTLATTTFVRCKNSNNHCVRKDLLCDTYVNCVWPDGDQAPDEANCDAYHDPVHGAWSLWRGGGGGHGDPGSSSGDAEGTLLTIPVIIIILVAVLVTAFVVLLVSKRLLVWMARKSMRSSRGSANTNNQGSPRLSNSGGPGPHHAGGGRGSLSLLSLPAPVPSTSCGGTGAAGSSSSGGGGGGGGFRRGTHHPAEASLLGGQQSLGDRGRPSAAPSAPPSYEEAVKLFGDADSGPNRQQGHDDYLGDPPPYSPPTQRSGS